MTKLYEIPRNSLLYVGEEQFLFHHIDGMYSRCTGVRGGTMHLKAWTMLEPYMAGYRVVA